MSTIFQYVWIDDNLIRDLSFNLCSGQSLVMLGYPNSGKGLVRRKLRNMLARESLGPVVSVNFMIGRVLETSDEARGQLASAVTRAGLIPRVGGSEILSPLDGLYGVPILFASNVDSLNHQIARCLLKEIRTRVIERKLVVIVSGEYGLGELVHGPNSEFNVAHQYVSKDLRARPTVSSSIDTYALWRLRPIRT